MPKGNYLSLHSSRPAFQRFHTSASPLRKNIKIHCPTLNFREQFFCIFSSAILYYFHENWGKFFHQTYRSHMRGWELSSSHFLPGHQIEQSGQIHAPFTLPEKFFQVLIKYVAWLLPTPIWIFWHEKFYLPKATNEARYFDFANLNILTALFRLYLKIIKFQGRLPRCVTI